MYIYIGALVLPILSTCGFVGNWCAIKLLVPAPVSNTDKPETLAVAFAPFSAIVKLLALTVVAWPHVVPGLLAFNAYPDNEPLIDPAPELLFNAGKNVATTSLFAPEPLITKLILSTLYPPK